MTISTNNFHPDADPKLLCTCGHPECDLRSVDQSTLNQVQRIRDDLGSPMTIISGGRCQHHPDEVRKASPGDHQKCKAVDVFYGDNATKTKLMVLAGRHGATRVAAGKNFVHMAWTETERRDVPTWEY
jgi:uncharacterized protein YcbK (DUF882 family)